jgi:hypothetical protein
MSLPAQTPAATSITDTPGSATRQTPVSRQPRAGQPSKAQAVGRGPLSPCHCLVLRNTKLMMPTVTRIGGWRRSRPSACHGADPPADLLGENGCSRPRDVPGRGEKGQRTAASQVTEPLQRRASLYCAEFFEIPGGEFSEPVRLVSVPSPQLGAWGNVREPLVDRRRVLTNLPRPNPVDQHVYRRRRLVRRRSGEHGPDTHRHPAGRRDPAAG